jgi:adenylate kinase family enzyme
LILGVTGAGKTTFTRFIRGDTPIIKKIQIKKDNETLEEDVYDFEEYDP